MRGARASARGRRADRVHHLALWLLAAASVLLPGGRADVVEAQSAAAPSPEAGQPWRPSPVHAALPLERLSPTLLAYDPHRGGAHVVRGTGHTHAAPDHSGIPVDVQERRLRDLDPGHRHDFAWITAHDVVVDDPDVDGITHMFGVEVYAGHPDDQDVYPHVVALLPDGRLSSRSSPPFGVRAHPPADLVGRIDAAGGRAVLAHPSRYSMTLDSVAALPAALWGIEGLSGNTDPADNERWIDARLSAGHYACISAGGDIHHEDYKLTTGYQVVSVRSAEPTREEIFDQVASCNFFACGVHSPRYPLIGPPALEVDGGALRFHTPTPVTLIQAIGAGGRELASAEDTDTLVYSPARADRYVRFVARRARGNAICLSQPVWLVPG